VDLSPQKLRKNLSVAVWMVCHIVDGMKPIYPSDLSDGQWALFEPLIPRTHEGRARTVDMRMIVNGILYRCRSGCQWRMLPKDYGPWQKVYYYFRGWSVSGAWARMNDSLREAVREAAGRDPTPSARGIDSQTVKSTEVGGGVGYDQAKKITGNGKKRHTLHSANGGGAFRANDVCPWLLSGEAVWDGGNTPTVAELPERRVAVYRENNVI